MYSTRVKKLQELLQASGQDGIYIQKGANIRYLSGYTGDGAFLVIGTDARFLITDFRYLEQAQKECPDYEVLLYSNVQHTLWTTIINAAKKANITTLGFETDCISYTDYKHLHNASNGIILLPVSGLVERLRRTKDATEIELMKEACRCTDDVFAQLIGGVIQVGMTEKELEWEIMHRMQLTGNGSYSEFATLSGVNGSLPHGKAVYTKRIEDGDFITMDFGCKTNGYHADMTRTVAVGTPTQRQREIYEIVRYAQQTAQEAIAPGVPAKEIDAIARDYITAQGYGEYFGHSTGHGVGLEMHEQPFVRATSDAILQVGDIITVEPGIYLPNWGGIRIEDTVLVTENGGLSLFNSDKSLICL